MNRRPTSIPVATLIRGLRILHEDPDLLVVCKEPGLLTTSYDGDRNATAERLLTNYLRKGSNRAWIRAYTVHRLDRETSGLLIFAKSAAVQQHLKGNWKDVEKHYTAVVHGCLAEKSGTFASYLAENADQFVYSTPDADKGKWSETLYKVIRETPRFSLLDITLLTGGRTRSASILPRPASRRRRCEVREEGATASRGWRCMPARFRSRIRMMGG
jgi:23S rRNA-/tRNA-specific pseudouridylate synthase